MKQVKWGIIGLGSIASKFADGFQFTKNARLFAISSKNENKLLEFKNKFQIDKNFCFSNYESLLECKDLDVVYIALPHSFHHEWVIKSIEKKKNILVEKPATVNFSQMENSCWGFVTDFRFLSKADCSRGEMWTPIPPIATPHLDGTTAVNS